MTTNADVIRVVVQVSSHKALSKRTHGSDFKYDPWVVFAAAPEVSLRCLRSIGDSLPIHRRASLRRKEYPHD